MSERPEGRFIVFEGVEGAGKSTQTHLLAEALAKRGVPVTRTLEPGGTAIGLRIRQLLLDPEMTAMDRLTELFLYSAARAQHVREVIRPALETGRTVICDRFSTSTLAYQGYARGLDLTLIRRLDEIARDGIEPDRILILDLPVRDGLGRNADAGKRDRFELESIRFHEKVRTGFHELAAGDDRIRIVPADGGPDGVHQRILQILDEPCP